MSCIHLVLWVDYAKYIMSCEFVFYREAGVSPQLHNVTRVYATSPEGCFDICDEVTCSASHRACHPEAAAFNYTAWGVEDIRLVRILPCSQVFATSICVVQCSSMKGEGPGGLVMCVTSGRLRVDRHTRDGAWPHICNTLMYFCLWACRWLPSLATVMLA